MKKITHTSFDFSSDGVRGIYVNPQKQVEFIVKFPLDLPPHTFDTPQLLNQNRDTFVGILKKAPAPTSYVSYLVPEDVIFTQLLEIPKVSLEEVPEAIYWKLKDLLPKDIESYNKDYLILQETQKQYIVLTFAVPKYILTFFENVFKEVGLTPVALEPRALALHRASAPSLPSSHVVILDITNEGTTLTYATKEQVLFSQTLPVGNNTIIEKIQISTNTPRDKILEQIEQKKLDKKAVLEALTQVTKQINTEFVRVSGFLSEEFSIKVNPKTILVTTSIPYFADTTVLALKSTFSKEIDIKTLDIKSLVKLPPDLPQDALGVDFAAVLGLNLKREVYV